MIGQHEPGSRTARRTNSYPGHSTLSTGQLGPQALLCTPAGTRRARSLKLPLKRALLEPSLLLPSPDSEQCTRTLNSPLYPSMILPETGHFKFGTSYKHSSSRPSPAAAEAGWPSSQTGPPPSSSALLCPPSHVIRSCQCSPPEVMTEYLTADFGTGGYPLSRFECAVDCFHAFELPPGRHSD